MSMIIIMTASLIAAIIFTQITHPLAMGLALLVQTLIISIMTGMMSQSFWFSYILFLVFLGGLLVLFIYVTSLASNEMFSMSVKMAIPAIIMSGGVTLYLLVSDPTFFNSIIVNNDTLNLLTNEFYHEEFIQSLSKLYNQPTGFITLMLVLYLFLTLIAVVKITAISYGPLRQAN
uniref:NADH dehydrogenase subunit 6 n=1 Tax=Neonemura barrosi TaxID=1777198 RepID=UPI0010C44E9E|nr:NADH dehydrogenase subunit 6 [Neonemura barrosi]QBR55130.1 NADH dehydrogenase subunit 6 [Neonemura barrosi]